ncbi:MAG: peroxiredoxin [Pseudomonadota bacterium]
MEAQLPSHLIPGFSLPEISLPATDGSYICLATLSGRSIVAIYPWTGRPGHPNPPGWDDIPGAHGSTPELIGLQDHLRQISKTGTRLYGLSGQATDYLREMALRLGLQFPILSDADGTFRSALHLPVFAAGADTYLKRLTFVVLAGRIEHVFYPVDDPAQHATEIVNWLQDTASV